jgi:nucleotide-binding universal stress UspA family protein
MLKKILLPVDASLHSKHAVQYAQRMASSVNDLHYVLFHVQPMISGFLQDEARKSVKAKSELDRVKTRNEKTALDLLGGCKEGMVANGIAAERIEVVTAARKMGPAKDILNFAEQRRFDAVIIGRRGISLLQKKLMGSVTAELLQHARVIPVWVVDGKVTSDKLLVAVDGSTASLRALDHVVFMVADTPATFLTLFHIKADARNACSIDFDEAPSQALTDIIARGEERCVDDFLAHARELLRKFAIGSDRYAIETARSVRNVGKAILNKARREGFGTIVIGRSGISRSFFMGSVSRYVIDHAADLALWVVT